MVFFSHDAGQQICSKVKQTQPPSYKSTYRLGQRTQRLFEYACMRRRKISAKYGWSPRAEAVQRFSVPPSLLSSFHCCNHDWRTARSTPYICSRTLSKSTQLISTEPVRASSVNLEHLNRASHQKSGDHMLLPTTTGSGHTSLERLQKLDTHDSLILFDEPELAANALTHGQVDGTVISISRR